MWLIKGTYNGKTEVLDSFDSLTEAIKMRREYELAYGIKWTITINKNLTKGL